MKALICLLDVAEFDCIMSDMVMGFNNSTGKIQYPWTMMDNLGILEVSLFNLESKYNTQYGRS